MFIIYRWALFNFISFLITDLFKPISKPVSQKEYYKILYEFEPRNPDEMAIEEGDIVIVRVQRNCIYLANNN